MPGVLTAGIAEMFLIKICLIKSMGVCQKLTLCGIKRNCLHQNSPSHQKGDCNQDFYGKENGRRVQHGSFFVFTKDRTHPTFFFQLLHKQTHLFLWLLLWQLSVQKKNCVLGPALPNGKAEGRDTWANKGLFSEVTFQVRTEVSYAVANELLGLWITNERTQMSKAAWWVSTSGRSEFPINIKVKAGVWKKLQPHFLTCICPKWRGKPKNPWSQAQKSPGSSHAASCRQCITAFIQKGPPNLTPHNSAYHKPQNTST